ncbi:MAG: proton-conducting transporter transmembrane domain-containing protein [Candidatus Methanomethylicaceae archaeon]
MSEYASNLWSIALLVIIPLLVAVVVNFLYNRSRAIKYISLIAALCLAVIAFISPYGFHWFTGHPALRPETLTFTFDPGFPAWRLSLEFYFGPMQQIMIFVMSLILIFVVAVAATGLTKHQGPYIGMIFLLFASAAIIIMVNDLYHLWIAVEIGSLVVAGVVVGSGTGVSHKAALKYTYFAALSGAGLAVALALILGLTGYSNISDAIRYLQSVDLGGMSTILYVAFGFFVLSWIYAGGLSPIHPLKSEVYGASFPHGTAMLQTQSKLMLVAIGIVMLRIFGTLPFVREVMLAISVITMMLGVVMALLQTDFRWILAYLIVSHSGLVTVGISLGTTEGLVGGMFQAVNDIIYMTVLLLCCEALYYFGGKTSTRDAAGIAKKAPWLAIAVVLGTVAASGIPPFNGFQSEIILIQAALRVGLPEVAAVILMVSVSTFIALFRGVYRIFLKPTESQDVTGEVKVPKSLYVGLGVFLTLTLVIGVYPDIIVSLLTPLAQAVSIPWYL